MVTLNLNKTPIRDCAGFSACGVKRTSIGCGIIYPAPAIFRDYDLDSNLNISSCELC